jgi:hypothetical protein
VRAPGAAHDAGDAARRRRILTARDTDPEILDEKRHPGERAIPWRPTRGLARLIERAVDDRVQEVVVPLGSVDRGVDQLQCGDFASADHRRERQGVMLRIVPHQRDRPRAPTGHRSMSISPRTT